MSHRRLPHPQLHADLVEKNTKRAEEAATKRYKSAKTMRCCFIGFPFGLPFWYIHNYPAAIGLILWFVLGVCIICPGATIWKRELDECWNGWPTDVLPIYVDRCIINLTGQAGGLSALFWVILSIGIVLCLLLIVPWVLLCRKCDEYIKEYNETILDEECHNPLHLSNHLMDEYNKNDGHVAVRPVLASATAHQLNYADEQAHVSVPRRQFLPAHQSSIKYLIPPRYHAQSMK